MTTFTFSTGDQIFDGTEGEDRFNIYGPDDVDRIYDVVANGQGGDDTLIHIDLDQVNITYNAGSGRDVAEILFGNSLSQFDFFLGSGNDQVILGDSNQTANGIFDIELGTGQDEVIIYEPSSDITISDFETGVNGDRLIISDPTLIDSLSTASNPIEDGLISLSQANSDVVLSFTVGGQVLSSITLEGTNVEDFTTFNLAGLSSDGSVISTTSYIVRAEDYQFGSTFFASLGDDIINVEDGISRLVEIQGLSGNDVLNGGAGTDNLFGGAGDDILFGNDGDDVLNYAVGGNDQLNGGAGNDTFRISNSAINGQSGQFEIEANGGAGDDRLIHIDSAVHTVEFVGGTGNDIAEVWASNSASTFAFDLGDGDDVVQIGSDSNVSFFRGGEGNYTLTLGEGSDELLLNSVGVSFSTISSPPPVQILITDFETGPSGDFLTLNFAEQIGNWDLGENPFDVGAARILQRGEDAVLQFEHYEYTSGTTTRTAIGWSDVVVFENTDALDFTAENFSGLSVINAVLDPTFRGSSEADILIGRASDDRLLGEDGNDALFGEAGNDILIGGAGADVLDGGVGSDTASYEGSSNRVVINAATNSVTSGHASGDSFISIENFTGSDFGDSITGNGADNIISGGNGFDILSGFSGDDTLNGGAGRDLLTGGSGADNIDGGDGISDMVRYFGSDVGVSVDLSSGVGLGGHAEGDIISNVEQLLGSAHADTLTGNNQNNFIFGSDGNDTLDGGAGIDKLFGGSGADIFVFGAGDTFTFITDWEDNVDSLDLSQFGFFNVEDALANMDQRGAHVRFFVEGETLLILNADLEDIADDILIANDMVG